MLKLLSDSPPSQTPDHPYCLTNDGLRHLALPLGPVDKDDRDLDDLESALPGAVAHLYLKGITVRDNLIQINGFENRSAKALESAGRVPHWEASHATRVNVREIAQQ